MIVAVVALAVVALALLVDRHLTAQRHAAEVETLLAAALSRSAGEFGGAVAKIKADGEAPKREPAEPVRPVVGL